MNPWESYLVNKTADWDPSDRVVIYNVRQQVRFSMKFLPLSSLVGSFYRTRYHIWILKSDYHPIITKLTKIIQRQYRIRYMVHRMLKNGSATSRIQILWVNEVSQFDCFILISGWRRWQGNFHHPIELSVDYVGSSLTWNLSSKVIASIIWCLFETNFGFLRNIFKYETFSLCTRCFNFYNNIL